MEDDDLVAFGDGRGYGTRVGNGQGAGDSALERERFNDPSWALLDWLLLGDGDPRHVDFDQPLATPVAFMAIDDETGGD